MAHVIVRNHVTVSGCHDGPTIVLAHGFGCDQHVWDRVAPLLEPTHRVVRFDHVGSGASDASAYDPERYATIDGYARDLVEIAEALGLEDATYVGHSIGGAIGVLADVAAPGRFGSLVLVGASARYLDDDPVGYRGGFTAADLHDVLEAIADNWHGWAEAMAPVIMRNPEHPELSVELHGLLARLDPVVARTFARATFRADVRDALARVRARTAVLHCLDDAVVPDEAARYLHEHLPGSRFVQLRVTGHCPPLSSPEELVDAIRSVERAPAAV